MILFKLVDGEGFAQGHVHAADVERVHEHFGDVAYRIGFEPDALFLDEEPYDYTRPKQDYACTEADELAAFLDDPDEYYR